MATNNLKNGNIKLTLSIDKSILHKYKEYCSQKGLIISKQVENFMKEQKNDKP